MFAVQSFNQLTFAGRNYCNLCLTVIHIFENFQGAIARIPHFVAGRAVSAALHIPKLGVAHAVTGGPKFSPVTITTQGKLRSLKLKYEALEISEVRGPLK